MTQQEIKDNFSQNLIKLRKARNLTQAKLAEELNYSDKAVSKWEVGAVVPDIETLVLVADYFGITVNDLIYKKQEKLPKKVRTKYVFITLLSFGLVWFIATLLFFVLNSTINFDRMWLVFIGAMPVSFIVLVVMTAIWFGKLWQFLSVSGLIWSIVTTIFLVLNKPTFWFVFIVGAVAQILVILWYLYKRHLSINFKFKD